MRRSRFCCDFCYQSDSDLEGQEKMEENLEIQ
jgi:hypothetical protein